MEESSLDDHPPPWTVYQDIYLADQTVLPLAAHIRQLIKLNFSPYCSTHDRTIDSLYS